MPDRNLTTLVGSRICHDLISPLGAIGNGLELLQMSGRADSPEVALIADSLENATARIRFFRVAYGDAKPDQQISGHEIASALRSGLGNTRLVVEFDAVDMERQTARLLFLALQCLETAMPYGGTITIDLSGQSLSLVGRADRFAREEALWENLTATAGSYELRPAQVQFALLRSLCDDEKRTLTVAQDDTTISIAL
ncbi:histidine phosphotransferase family protein [Tropicimonas sp. S265A]|uniref:histidine phosphotransferase family protein n=1 Tax=Tropicimonas sp. S265A TaxID=3415134 RepID=UPI003C7DC686